MIRPSVRLALLASIALGAAWSLPISADSRERAARMGAEREGEEASLCPQGETPEYFAARYNWYLERYGANGVFDPERRLAEVRSAYAAYLADVKAGRRPLVAPAPETPFQPGTFKFLGPANGAGRATAIDIHPTDASTVYVGAAGGGLWKSTDAGSTWTVLTDGLGDLSVGAVAIAPSAPNTIYLGTGEGGYAGDFIPGIGLFKSTDAGATWQAPSSVVAPLIYRISVDPRNASNLLVLTNAGVQRSTDGGASFTRTSDTIWGDATDIARDPTNPDILHAVFWNQLSSGETSRYARSNDNGATWVEKSTGLPANPKSRASIALSSDGKSVYSMISGPGTGGYKYLGVYRSTDGGENWAKATTGSTSQQGDVLSGQGWYDNTLGVDPENAQIVILGGGGRGMFKSSNGGQTITAIGNNVHVDHHQILFRKVGSTSYLWTANDGGVWLSTDGGASFTDKNKGLGTRQFYSVAIDPTRPGIVYAGAQDNGTVKRVDEANNYDFVFGGDGFEAAVNPDEPSRVFVSSQYATIYRLVDEGDGNPWYVAQTFAGAPFTATGGDGVKPFYTVITLDPNDPKRVYTGTYRVWRSDDSGESWSPLAGDAFDPVRPVYAIAVAKGRPDRIVATQSRRVLISDDGGKSFTNITSGLPSASVVFRNAEIDPVNSDVIYLAANNFNTGTPGQLFKSTNGGASWARSDAGLPAGIGTEVVRVDPGDVNTVYAGSLFGLYRSTNAGATWQRFGDGLPAVAIHEIRLTPDGARLVVATHGRGVWAADALHANRTPQVSITSPSGATTINAGQSVTFAGSATDADGDAVALKWTFGDGMTGSGANPGAVRYLAPGLYTVWLIGEDARGGRGGASLKVTVKPTNDACANAQPLPLLADTTVVVRTGNAGTQTTDPTDPPTCANPDVTNTVWFTFTPPSDGSLDLDTFGSLGDTILALYDTPCGSSSPAVDCNDDAKDVSGGPSQIATQSVVASKTYRVLVGSWGDIQGTAVGSPFIFPADSLRLRATFKPTLNSDLGPGTTTVLPVVLDAYGKGGARFQSDLLALNRGNAPLTVAMTYGGQVGGYGETTGTLVIPPGAQIRAADALAELRREGVSVPATTPAGSQIGSLTALVTAGDASALILASRTASPNPNTAVGGTFGLFSAGTPFASAADSESVYVFGLRQTTRDRANLALVNVRTPRARTSDGSITLAVDVFDANGTPAPTPIPSVTLASGEWRQLNEVLAQAGLTGGVADGGYVRVRRMAGAARFVAYGVVNDQITADGSFVAMTRAGEVKASDSVLVPIVLEAGGVGGSFFTSELILANRSTKSGTAKLTYVASPLFGGAGSGSVNVTLAAGAQKVIPNFIQYLRSQGLSIPSGSAQGGSLFVTFTGLDAGDDVYAGVRTSTPNADAAQGGSFGVFTPGVASSALATTSAIVPGLRQDGSVRSNLAVVNGGNETITLSVQIKNADGASVGTVLTKTLAAGEWYQWSNVFDKAGLGTGEGYAVITRTSGNAAWLAYGALNDGATSDGSVLNAVR